MLPFTVTNTPALTQPELLPWHYIDPSSEIYRIWKFLVAFVAIIISFLAPYMFGFVLVFNEGVLHTVDLVLMVVMLFDCIVSCFVAHISERTGAFILDRHVRNYIGAIIEFVLCLPTCFLCLMLPVWVIKAISFFRLVVIRRVFNLITSLEKKAGSKMKQIVKWFKVLFVLFVALNTMAAVLYLIASTNPNKSRTWWSSADEEIKKEKNHDLFLYVMSLYLATTTLSTVGYGDLHPINGMEMAFTIAFMLLGMILVTYVCTAFTNLLFGKQQEGSISDMSTFATANSLPSRVRQEMYDYLSYESQAEKRWNPPFLATLPKSLQTQVKCSQYMMTIRGSYLFKNVPNSLISMLISKMKVYTLPPGAHVILRDEVPNLLHILVEGEMVEEGGDVQVSVCGEFGLICLQPQPFSVVTRRDSVLLRLKRKSLLKVLQIKPEDGSVVIQNMLERSSTRLQSEELMSIYQGFNQKIDCQQLESPLNLKFLLNLKFAAGRHNPILLRRLIQDGGHDVNAIYYDGQTALHIAAQHGCDDSVDVLLQNNADVTRIDAKGDNALCYAVRRRSAGTILLLRQHQANLPVNKALDFYIAGAKGNDLQLLWDVHFCGGIVNMADEDGWTPFHYAGTASNTAAVNVLKHIGAIDFGTNRLPHSLRNVNLAVQLNL